MRKIVSFLAMLLLITTLASAQNRTITGTVTDENGDAVPGASVRIKGTRTGVAADNNGQFKIQAKSGDVLVVSGAGVTPTETIVGSGNEVTIVTKRTILTEGEVIVTGVAGATSREKMTVSVTKISAERINAVPPTSLASALTGKVAGVKTSSFGGLPGQALDIQLRADNNLNNVGSGPLIIVDGAIITGSLADINADDVESMEVVKGAAASALYGSRAANGVIAVTTKRGKGAIGTTVTVRNEIGFQSLAKELETAKHHYYTLASDWESVRGSFTKYAGIVYPAGYSGSGYHPNIVGNRAVDPDHYLDNEFGVDRNTQKEFFGTGINYTNYVGIGSRSEKSNVYFSFENNSQEGIVKLTDGYKRQNFRLNFDHQLTPWLKLSTSNVFINKKVQYPGGTGSLFYDIARFDPDIDLNEVNPVDGQPYYPKINQWNGEQVNPLYRLYKQTRLDKTRRWLSNYAINVKFTKWANLDVSQSIEIENYRYTRLDPKDTWKTSGGTAATYSMAYTNGGEYQFSSETNSKNTQATLNLAHKFGSLSVKGKLSYLYENREYEDFDITGSQFVINDIPSFNNFSSISNGTSSITQEKAQNFFAIASLDYKDRYLLDGMFRYDRSSLFGPDARSNPYFRISGAYRISEDVKISGIDELKIRAAYGTAGIRPGFSWQYETYNLSSGVASAKQKGNENLKPSKTAEKEIGLNVNFLKKFTFEGTYAKSETTDQFLNVNLIPFLNDGFSSQYQNAGTVQSNTLELTLGANWLTKGDLSITSNIVFAKVRQKITDFPIPAYTYTDQSQGDQYIFYAKANETYGAMYGRRFVRTLDDMSRQLPAGKTISDYEVNSDGYVVPVGTQGLVTEIPIIYSEGGNPWYGKIGDGNADFNMGISNTIRYKGISLYFLLDWKQGGDIYNGKNQRLVFNLASSILDQSNVPVGQKKTFDYYNAFYDGNNSNQYWVEKGTYMKLREVALGYTLNSKALQGVFKGAVKEITAKVIGRNLLTFTKYSGYDPEVGTIRQPYDGIYMNPNYRNIAVSLSVNF
ncbi:MAG: SusC/RagA family TonB-linked outer membrane protein [Chitinophagaceae bacterium]|nr:SusC/RagA family TonB-linked outer membrane protein [Chitinophagaceae bacterium]